MAKKKKLPTDTNKKAKAVVDLATSDKGEKDNNLTKEQISEMMSKIGKMGGKKGGPARKAALTSKERIAIAKKAAAARWGHKEK